MHKFPYRTDDPGHLGDNLQYLDRMVVKTFKQDGTPISDMVRYFGESKLSAGKVEVGLPHSGFKNWYVVTFTVKSDTATAYGYSIDYHSLSKFVIHSSDSGDTAEVRWMAIGY